MAKFLVNENIPKIAIEAAQDAGIDIIWVKEVMRGAADDAILARAVKERRVLVTFNWEYAPRFDHPKSNYSR